MEKLFAVIEETARKKGVWAELWGERERGISVERRDGRLEALKPYEETVLAVRVIHRGRAGLFYTTTATPEALKEAVLKAYEMSLFSEEEALIPEPEELPQITPKTPVFRSPETLLASLEEAEEAAFAAGSKVHRIERSGISFAETSYFLFQTEGLSATFKIGAYTFFISLTVREGEEERSAWEWQAAEDLAALDLQGLSRRAAERALNLLSAKRLSSRKLPVLFGPQVAVSLLETLSPSFCGDEVAKGRSRLADKLGKKIFSPNFTLIDDGLFPGGLETRPFDDEGVAQRETILVKEGEIVAFLYDTLWGRRAGRGSTGNARRPSFKSLPSVSPTNLYLAPGDTPPEDLRKSFPALFEVYEMLGWHTTDPVSGDFSVGVSGVLYEKGNARPVAGMALSGNLFDLLSRIVAVGSDLTFYGDVGSPSLFIADLDLSGA